MQVGFFDLSDLNSYQRSNLCRKRGIDIKGLVDHVHPLIEEVRIRGDEAIRDLTLRFDGADIEPSRFQVQLKELDDAVESIPEDLRKAIEISISNIRKFHKAQVEPEAWEIEIGPGISAGERIVPLKSVGLYIPRGKGSFPSMMMMAAIPAMVAGVERIVVVTPPDKKGKADLATLAAARLIGLAEVYAVGGVQAIAALAFGSVTIPRVDKIVGPGSGFVMAAKHIVSTEVDTGLPAGPSESIVLADGSCSALIAATDMLIEAEHGPDSASYLVTDDPVLADLALELIPKLLSSLPNDRMAYCISVFENNGGVVLAKDLEDAVNFVNEFAPEHLQILTSNPRRVLEKIRTAGEVLLGEFTPGTLANYSIGPNAILPTSGFARTASALSVRDFTRRIAYSEVSEDGFGELAPHSLVLARYEGFPAHAQALVCRLDRDD
jgi:histidinol dehydrogenase